MKRQREAPDTAKRQVLFTALPPELLNLILQQLTDQRDLHALATHMVCHELALTLAPPPGRSLLAPLASLPADTPMKYDVFAALQSRLEQLSPEFYDELCRRRHDRILCRAHSSSAGKLPWKENYAAWEAIVRDPFLELFAFLSIDANHLGALSDVQIASL